jgi:hypothetical protein
MPSPNVVRAIAACVAAWPALAAAVPSVDQQQPVAVPVAEDPGLLVGGGGHQVVAQVVTAGRPGTLVAVAAPAFCLPGASLRLEVRGVRPDLFGRLVPDAAVRASGTMPAAFLPAFADAAAPDFRMLPLAQPVPLEAGERFSLVLSAAGDCGLARGPAGDPYPGGDGSFIDDLHAPYYEWLWFFSRLDLPFETWLEPPPLEVRIDVKPGGDENPVNLGARGTIPVAILGSAELDVRTVDLATVQFAGAAPAADGRGRPRASLEDVNADGIADLVLHFPIAELALRPGDVEAILTASTRAPDAAELVGSDRVRVVPAATSGSARSRAP